MADTSLSTSGRFDEIVMVTLSASSESPSSLALSHQLEMTRYVIQRFVNVIVVIFGVIGNVFNVVILTRRWMKSSTNHYLTALAVYDCLYLVLSLSLGAHHYASFARDPWYVYYRLPVGRPLTDVCSNTGVWLILTFSVERYIVICFPIRGKVWCTTRRAKYVIFGVCLGALAATAPEFFEVEIVRSTDRMNRTLLRENGTWFGTRRSYRIGYYHANHALFTFIPLALLLFFNFLLIRAVVCAARQRRRMTKADDLMMTSASKTLRHQRYQQRTTMMLISVVVVFFVCQLPQSLQKLYLEYRLSRGTPLDAGTDKRLKIAANYFNLLVMFNCSVNFVLYSSFSTKFRLTLTRLFRRARRTPEVVLTTTNVTFDLTQMDDLSSDCRRVSEVSASMRGSPSSIASFSVTNPQQRRSRSPQLYGSRSPQNCRSRSPSKTPTGSPVLVGVGGDHTYERFAKNRLSPSDMEMKTFA